MQKWKHESEGIGGIEEWRIGGIENIQTTMTKVNASTAYDLNSKQIHLFCNIYSSIRWHCVVCHCATDCHSLAQSLALLLALPLAILCQVIVRFNNYHYHDSNSGHCLAVEGREMRHTSLTLVMQLCKKWTQKGKVFKPSASITIHRPTYRLNIFERYILWP